jgi:two-component system sensor histidine kinase UhpB
MRILLVEDNADHRELMCLALTGHNATWQVEGVVSGEEALRHLAEREAYDVVFLDYSLPGRDGLEVLEEIRRGEAPPSVVMVTGYGDERVAVEAMKGGAYDYLVKVEGYLQRLPVVAQRAVERKQAEEELREKELFNFALFEYNPIQTVVVNLEGKVTRFNRAKKRSGDRLPNIGDVMYKDYAGMHEIDMYAELMKCIRSGEEKEFPEQKYGEKVLSITISPFPKGAVIISQDITERKRTEKEQISSHEQLRALAARLQFVREEERTQIAREIHDELGQELTGLKMDLSWLIKRLPKNQESLISKTESMLKLVDSTIQTVRRISSELRPGVLDDLGLIAAIEWQAQDFENRTGITCDFSSSVEEIDLVRDRSTAVFRIFQ